MGHKRPFEALSRRASRFDSPCGSAQAGWNCRGVVDAGSRARTSTALLASFIVILIAVFFTGPNYIRSIGSGTELTLKDWGYSPVWLESAECARTTGVPLIGCRDNKRVPYAEIAPSDDP